jgi:hypothetical protein
VWALKAYWVCTNTHVIGMFERMLAERGFRRAQLERQPRAAAVADPGTEGGLEDCPAAEAEREEQRAAPGSRTGQAVYLQGPARNKAVFQDA